MQCVIEQGEHSGPGVVPAGQGDQATFPGTGPSNQPDPISAGPSGRPWLVSRWCRRRLDQGMATAEYAIATLAAAGFAGLLLVLLRSGEVRALLMGIVQRALTVG